MLAPIAQRMASTVSILNAPSSKRGYVAAISSSDQAIYAVGGAHSGMLLVSSNGIDFHPRGEFDSGLRSVIVVQSRVFVCGQHGHLAYSDDEGATWTSIDTKVGGCIYDFEQVEGALLASADGGVLHRIDLQTLEVTQVDTGASDRLLRVANTEHGVFLLDGAGELRRATALGQPFEVVYRGHAPLTQLAVTERGTVLVSGDAGQLVRSSDGGKSFTPVRRKINGDVEGVAVFGGDVVAWGAGGMLIRAVDDGVTFAAISLPLAVRGKTLWAAHALGEAAVLGGDDGLLLSLDALPKAWTERPDRFLPDYPLVPVFEGGPAGFIETRLRAFVGHVNGFDPAVVDAKPTEDVEPDAPEEDEEEDLDMSEFQGEDAWKVDAIRRVRGLWSGDSGDFQAVWGVEPPAELCAFERAVAGANPWRTFNELRLDVPQIAAPSDDDTNVFEQLILNDQLNYLGTALPGAFSGLAGIGTLGNGDSYYLGVPGLSDAASSKVVFYDHEQHCFTHEFAFTLDSLAYLCALTRADDDDALPAEAAAAGYEALHGLVNPSWHFSMDERDDEFEELETDDKIHRFCFWRSRWLITLFRHDHGGEASAVGESFMANLNPPITEDMAVERAKVAKGIAATAIYAAWRAYIFEEPQLELYLSVCRDHASRIARDAGRLIEELRGGRKQLGRILDWPATLAAVRALDLDPRRAEARAEEEKDRAAKTEARTAELTGALASLSGEGLEAFCREHARDASVRRALIASLLDRPELDQAKRAATFLHEQGYSRDNCLYRDEQHGACRYLADHADTALQLLLVGEALLPSEVPEGEEQPFPALGFKEIEQMLLRWQHTRALSPHSVALLRQALADDEIGPRWRLASFASVLGRVGDRESAEIVADRVRATPAEGGFETRLHHDDVGRDLAEALGRVGAEQHGEALVAMAKSETLLHAPAAAVLALARIAPSLADDVLFARTLERTTKVNNHQDTARALLAYTLMAKAQPASQHAERLAQLEACEPLADRYPDVRLSRAYAAYALAGETDRSAVVEALRANILYSGYEPISSHRFVLEFLRDCPSFGADVADVLPSLLATEDDVFRDDVLAQLDAQGASFERPADTLHWLSVEGMDVDEALRTLADDRLQGRHWLAVRLAGEATDAVRSALEGAMSQVIARAPKKADAKLARLDGRLLKEVSLAFAAQDHVPVALYDRALRHPNRNVKDPILRNPPAIPELADAMRAVAAEKYGWQESTALTWLEEHG